MLVLDVVPVAEVVCVPDVCDTVVTGVVETVLAVDCVAVVAVVVLAGVVLMVVPTDDRKLVGRRIRTNLTSEN